MRRPLSGTIRHSRSSRITWVRFGARENATECRTSSKRLPSGLTRRLSCNQSIFYHFMAKALFLSNAGESLRFLKFNYDASVEYKKALDLQPYHIRGLFGYGEVLKVMKKYPQSLVCYKRILEVDPANMEAVQLKCN